MTVPECGARFEHEVTDETAICRLPLGHDWPERDHAGDGFVWPRFYDVLSIDLALHIPPERGEGTYRDVPGGLSFYRYGPGCVTVRLEADDPDGHHLSAKLDPVEIEKVKAWLDGLAESQGFPATEATRA